MGLLNYFRGSLLLMVVTDSGPFLIGFVQAVMMRLSGETGIRLVLKYLQIPSDFQELQLLQQIDASNVLMLCDNCP